MSRTAADREQRQQALSPDRSFIVQAPAGSGKTELLIQRFLELLSVVDHPEEIVAITFTRKAAAEMQGRIIMALEQARTDIPPQEDFALTTYELARKALAQDQKKAWRLVSNPNRLRIQTIDSLCANLTRQMPILSGFGAQPQTIEDAGELYREAAANALEELESGTGWSDAVAVLLTHLDNDLPRIRDMLANMLRRRDQWLPYVASGQRRSALENALTHLVESTLSMVVQVIPEPLLEELLELSRYAATNLEERDIASPLRYCLDMQQLPGSSAADLPRWQAIAALLLKADGNWRRRVDARLGFPPPAGSRAEKELCKAMKDQFAAVTVELSKDEQRHSLLLEIQALPAVTYTDAEWQVVDALCRLLTMTDAQLRVLFAEHNQVDFSAVTQAAIQALGNPQAPSDLALHLDYRMKHLLVDEFQDISTSQYILLTLLTAGWSPEDGRTLFLVGDPMQSIYRFREAEVGMFLDIYQERRLGQVELTPLHLSVNFRSRAKIVSWVNETFKQLFPAETDSHRGAVSYARVEAFSHQSAANAVQIHPLPGRDEQIEAEKVLELVNTARQSDPDGSIAILVRNRVHLSRIIPCLQRAGMRFRAVDIEELGQRTVIQDLLALGFALNHFADRIAWLAVLRAPWCGLTLCDLFMLAGKSRDKTVWKLMHDEATVRTLTEDGQQRLTKLREILTQAFSEQRRRSLRRWVESVWIRLGGPATLQEETDLENAHTFFALLDQFDEGGDLRNRSGFLEQVANLYAAADVGAEDRLQIMTLHKAKGLEFDTVILPGLGRGSGRDETSLLLWAVNPHESSQDLLLAPVKAAGDNASPIHEYIDRLEKKKQRYEEGRLLYVAATRARKQLHLLGTVDVKDTVEGPQLTSPPANSLLARLWGVLEENFMQALNAGNQDDSDDATGRAPDNSHPLRRLTADWTLPDPPVDVTWEGKGIKEQSEYTDTGIEYQWAGETIKHIGTVVHRCIQLITEQGIDEWDEEKIRSRQNYYRLLLKQSGVPDKEIKHAGKQVEEALIKMIQDERGRWIVSGEHTEQQNEYALSGFYHDRIINVVIDRTFVDNESNRWIVDYKTSRHTGSDVQAFLDQEEMRYRQQLHKYGVLMQMLDDRRIKLGLYFPLLQGWREWEMDSYEERA
ncbi:MAG: UvrD-helicase domain-containing protein [Gammaproteobacteria bacterium]